MIFLSPEDFFRKVKAIKTLDPREEKEWAGKLRAGDPEARERLVESYLPFVASAIGRLPREYQTLELIFRCRTALEKAVDSFDFLQDSEPFAHRLNWWLRQTVTAYIAEKHS